MKDWAPTSHVHKYLVQTNLLTEIFLILQNWNRLKDGWVKPRRKKVSLCRRYSYITLWVTTVHSTTPSWFETFTLNMKQLPSPWGSFTQAAPWIPEWFSLSWNAHLKNEMFCIELLTILSWLPYISDSYRAVKCCLANYCPETK